jgi:hypothetical protein
MYINLYTAVGPSKGSFASFTFDALMQEYNSAYGRKQPAKSSTKKASTSAKAKATKPKTTTKGKGKGGKGTIYHVQTITLYLLRVSPFKFS